MEKAKSEKRGIPLEEMLAKMAKVIGIEELPVLDRICSGCFGGFGLWFG